jgi:hypothetical protein
MWSDYFLIWNNFTFLLLIPVYMYVGTKRHDIEMWKFSWHIMFCVLMTANSTFYHLCQTPLQYCVNNLSYDSLLTSDVTTAMVMICAAVSIFLPDRESTIYLSFMYLLCFCMSLFFVQGLQTSITILVINVLVMAYYRGMSYMKHPFKNWTAWAALCVFIVAISLKQGPGNRPTDEYDYKVYHGFWHPLAALACGLLIYNAIHVHLYDDNRRGVV